MPDTSGITASHVDDDLEERLLEAYFEAAPLLLREEIQAELEQAGEIGSGEYVIDVAPQNGRLLILVGEHG